MKTTMNILSNSKHEGMIHSVKEELDERTKIRSIKSIGVLAVLGYMVGATGSQLLHVSSIYLFGIVALIAMNLAVKREERRTLDKHSKVRKTINLIEQIGISIFILTIFLSMLFWNIQAGIVFAQTMFVLFVFSFTTFLTQAWWVYARFHTKTISEQLTYISSLSPKFI